MSKSDFRLTFPAVMILTIAAIHQVTSGFNITAGIEEPAAFDLINRALWIWVIGWWLINDYRGKPSWLPYCVGVFLFVGGPLIAIYHLFRTRGIRALIPIGIFLGVCVVASLLGVMLGIIVS